MAKAQQFKILIIDADPQVGSLFVKEVAPEMGDIVKWVSTLEKGQPLLTSFAPGIIFFCPPQSKTKSFTNALQLVLNLLKDPRRPKGHLFLLLEQDQSLLGQAAQLCGVNGCDFKPLGRLMYVTSGSPLNMIRRGKLPPAEPT